MSKDKTNGSENNPKKVDKPSTGTANSDGTKSVESNSRSNNSDQHPRNRPKIKANKWLFHKDNQPVIANIIALLALLIGAYLAYYTYQVFNLSRQQTAYVIKSVNASEVSANAAKLSADLQKQALDSQFSAKKQSDIADAKKLKRDTDFVNKQKIGIDAQITAFKKNEQYNREVFGVNSRALELQIKALKQSSDQFIKQNEPYLKVAVDSIFMQFGQPVLHYTVFNLSNTPALVNGQSQSLETTQIPPIRIYDPEQLDNYNQFYLIKESPQSKSTTIKDKTEDQKKWIMNGVYSLYWRAIFHYKNMITDENRTYSVYVKITKLSNNRGWYPEFIENTNK